MPEKGKTFAGEVREETVAWSKDTYQLLKQAEQGKVKSYVQDIALAVLDCKETATSRETFIRLMNERGYGVDWQDSHKYITYTDLAREQAGEKACKIRDNYVVFSWVKDGLHGYTSSTVTFKNGAYLETYNAEGELINSVLE